MSICHLTVVLLAAFALAEEKSFKHANLWKTCEMDFPIDLSEAIPGLTMTDEICFQAKNT